MFDSELAIHHSEEFFASDHLTGGIERRIMQAYVHLVFEPEGLGSIRTVTVGRFGALEARLTELPRDRLLMDVPPFWLEVFASADQTSIDSLGFFEFDDTEMVSAVELIVDAVRGEF